MFISVKRSCAEQILRKKHRTCSNLCLNYVGVLFPMSISRLKYTLKLKLSLYFSVICMAGSDQMIDDKTLTLILLLFRLCRSHGEVLRPGDNSCNRLHCFKWTLLKIMDRIT